MRILLVNAFTRQPGSPRIFPVQLSSVGRALIDAGHDVFAVDMDEPGNPDEKLRVQLNGERFDWIGVSFRNLPLAYWLVGFKSVRKLLRRLRRHTEFLVVGGAGFSLFYEMVFPKLLEADAGIVGEGEMSVVELSRSLEGYKNVPGICFMEDGRLRVNLQSGFLPGECFPRLGEVPGLVYKGYESIGVQSARGCDKMCKNCTVPGLRGNVFRLRKIEDVVFDLKFLFQKGVRHFRFINPEFNFPWEHSNELLDVLVQENLKMTWEGFLFPDSRIHEGYLLKAEEAGCRGWHIDLESGNESLYSFLHEGLTLDVVRSIQKMFPRSGAKIYYYFTYNFPRESFVEEKDTIALIDQLNDSGIPYEQIFSCPYMPYPGTPLAEEAKLNVLEKGWGWHVLRSFEYMFRPSSLFFLKLFFKKGKY